MAIYLVSVRSSTRSQLESGEDGQRASVFVRPGLGAGDATVAAGTCGGEGEA
jgi:hypothetical protein